MTHKEHCGWFNYETWAVALWMDNEEGAQSYWRERAREFQGDAYRLADAIKDEHEEALPQLQGFASDLLNAAMSEVNWQEIAENLLRDVAEEDGETTANEDGE